MLVRAWHQRVTERLRRDSTAREAPDLDALAALVWRLQFASESGDRESTRRWLHAVQVALAACAPSHSEEMRLALGDVVGLLGLDDKEKTHV